MKYLVIALALLLIIGLLLGRRRQPPSSQRSKPRALKHGAFRSHAPVTAYAGDFTGPVVLAYQAHPDGRPDPGEVVWTWVPFQEDHSKGKDRPVLLIGRDDRWLLGLMLTSKDHDHDDRRPDIWLDIGTGDWDSQRRPSEVRLDRIIRVDPDAVRREGAMVSKETFNAVARSLYALHNW